MATQSSISVSGSSEQKVPSVRKGGRGGGGNRNSGGGPGHSGHSVLSSVSSSSILHLSVLKTTRKINARLILLTELLIGGGREALSLPPLTHHLSNLFFFFFFFFRLAWRVDFFFSLPPPLPPPSFSAELLARVERCFLFSPSKTELLLPDPCSRPGTPQNARHGGNNLRRKSRYLGGAAIVREPRTILPGRGSKREKPRRRKGKGRERSWRINSLANEDTVEGKQGAAHEAKGEVKKRKTPG